MHPIRRSALALSLILAALPASAAAAGEAACLPQIRDGWLRLPPMAMPMLAGFGRIDNRCAEEATVVAARSAAFAGVELHETRVVDGVSRMRAVPALRLPAQGEAVLAPGGLHLMLMQPRAPLQAGQRVELEFELEDGRILRGEFVVRSAIQR